MITNSKEYYSLLYTIQDKSNEYKTVHQEPPMRMPENEPTLKVDLNNRTIEAPETLGVQHDHYSETVFFEVDRYYNEVDLWYTTCVVEYENKTTKKSRIYIPPYCDIIEVGEGAEKDAKLIIPWCISGEATREAGIVEYSLKFYDLDLKEDTDLENPEFVMTFLLNLQPTRSKVLKGMGSATIPEDYDVAADTLLSIYKLLNAIPKVYQLNWLEVE